ncbi:uncharacterized protein LOC127260040 isoform X2 [Andrographis paniculata]|uniref:uncharacterized protein LOC127260040 isoform X2 n=1 Tax=Andrographis paniculata TaxID=175694 RepID=UPI0021E8BAC6|nr:uncharacterized protein LOC127260040 isoform X2 [Andrographis paniculata]
MREEEDPTLRPVSSSTSTPSRPAIPVGQQSAVPSAGPPVIHWEEDPMLRQISSSTSTPSRSYMLSGPVAADPVVEPTVTEHQPSVVPDLVQPTAEPAPSVLTSVQADPQPVQADPEPVPPVLAPVQADPQPVQADPEPVQHLELVDVSSSESDDPSVNQNREAVGSKPGFIGPHPTAAKSVAWTRIQPGPPPLTPVLPTPCPPLGYS